VSVRAVRGRVGDPLAGNPDLQERELVKRAALTGAMAEALGERGVKEPTAGLAAQVGALAL
jgi:hypothetical protein